MLAKLERRTLMAKLRGSPPKGLFSLSSFIMEEITTSEGSENFCVSILKVLFLKNVNLKDFANQNTELTYFYLYISVQRSILVRYEKCNAIFLDLGVSYVDST
jgi:hypothetical protein